MARRSASAGASSTPPLGNRACEPHPVHETVGRAFRRRPGLHRRVLHAARAAGAELGR
jgi:hypothetical protein